MTVTIPILRINFFFLVEQLKLLVSPLKRYSAETLLFAFRLFSTSRKALDIVRQEFLTLPHSAYLRKISTSFGIKSGLDISACHEEYLQKKLSSLEPAQREVNLMLDEIHITGQLSYREGKLEGAAANTEGSEATTAQVGCISFLIIIKITYYYIYIVKQNIISTPIILKLTSNKKAFAQKKKMCSNLSKFYC